LVSLGGARFSLWQAGMSMDKKMTLTIEIHILSPAECGIVDFHLLAPARQCLLGEMPHPD